MSGWGQLLSLTLCAEKNQAAFEPSPSGHLTSAPRVVPLETGVAEGGETQSGNREAWSAPAASSSSASEFMPDLCSAQGLKFE